MSRTKRWLEELSVEMGFGGEITDEVMAEGRDRMGGGPDKDEDPVEVLVSSGDLIEAITDREVEKSLADTKFMARLGLIDVPIGESFIKDLRESVYPDVKKRLTVFLGAVKLNLGALRVSQQDKKEE